MKCINCVGKIPALVFVLFIIPTFLLSSCGGGMDCSKSPGVYQRGYEQGKLNRLIGYKADREEIEVEYGRGISRDFMSCLVEGYNEGYSGKESRYPDAETTVSSSSKTESSYNPYTYTPEPEKEETQPVKSNSVNNMMEEKTEKTYTVKGTNVNVRSGPGRHFDVVFQIDRGEYFQIANDVEPYGDFVNGSKGNWVKIEQENYGSGWIFDTFIYDK